MGQRNHGTFMIYTSGIKLQILQVRETLSVSLCLARSLTLTVPPDPYSQNKVLRAYEDREDVETYTVVLCEILHLFGDAIKESLTRTMGNYLESTGGRQTNANKTEWEKEITSRMICTNNPAESPFATVRAYLDIYPSLKLRTLATTCTAVCNGNPHPNVPWCVCFVLSLLAYLIVTQTITQTRYTPATTWL